MLGFRPRTHSDNRCTPGARTITLPVPEEFSIGEEKVVVRLEIKRPLDFKPAQLLLAGRLGTAELAAHKSKLVEQRASEAIGLGPNVQKLKSESTPPSRAVIQRVSAAGRETLGGVKT